jgi:hypothetical protein
MGDGEEADDAPLVLREPDLIMARNDPGDERNVLVGDGRQVGHASLRPSEELRERVQLVGFGRSNVHTP